MQLYIADIQKVSLDQTMSISPDRAERVKRLKNTDDKKRCIASGLLLNKYLGDANISENKFGKPICDKCFFNLSHSGRYVLLAVSDSEVGCDIEQNRIKKYLGLGKIVFCENEMRRLETSADRMTEFYRLWTKKESLLKCMGDGFHRAPKSVDVSGDYFEENGTKYYMKTIVFADYIVSVCSLNEKCVIDNIVFE